MARHYLLECENVHFIYKGSPVTSKADYFWVDLLGEVKGGSTNKKRVAKSHAPTMCSENGVEVVDSHALNHGTNVFTLILP